MSATTQEPSTRPLRILVVEDDDNHAEIIIRSLKRNKQVASLDRVSDGEQAHKYLQAAGRFAGRPPPDLILVDLKLPKIDGHQFLSSIKKDPALCKIPAIVLTTSNAESDRLEAYRCGANSYLVKPANFLRFRELLNHLAEYWGVWNRPASSGDG